MHDEILKEFIPAASPNEGEKNRIRVIYSRLEAMVHELENCSDDEITHGGPVKLYEETLKELESLAKRSLKGFMPQVRQEDDAMLCHTKDLRRQAGSLLGELRAEFLPEQEQYYYPATQPVPTTTITNYNSARQDVKVSQELELRVVQETILEIDSRISELASNYDEGSPERNFLTKLKEGLQSVKELAGLLVLIPSTAQTVGLGLDKLEGILKALKLL